MPQRLGRRSLLFASTTLAVSLAGCPGRREPQTRTYTLTITRSDQTLHARIEPAGDVPDVIRVYVGDTVEFTVVNQADVAIGVHEHASDAEFVIDPGATHEESFEAVAAMTGRQEIEAWVAETGHEGSGDHDDHAPETSTLAIIEVRPRSG